LLLEGRDGGRNEKEFIQSQFLHGGLRNEQVAQMNGIESAAEKSKALHRAILGLWEAIGDGNSYH
jgi:hypothetical protein